ncbi:PASTA domain-containing protein [Nonomuraea sp. NPDC049709]|uniref:serine/threonine-protein kinase n=1 Tax=Nonomuraea sp. NPDC049709 TaxID=3154736 RepID=UPI003425F610
MPTAQPLRTGDPQRLGEYHLSGRLGEGGQGAVFLGSRGGETYAVKLLHGPVGDERAAFLREVELAKHVARFCTAQVIDAGFDEGRPYIVSEYVDGPSLQREVALTGPRRGGGLERLAVSTATALAAIHRAGIVHRDFKPQNVLLGSDGPRVIDFGLARALDAAATVSGRGVGTPAYMAPEQITASAVTGAADVFSWGATMCFAANASAPFGQDSVAPVLHRILTAPPDLGLLDGRLRTLVEACLDKDARNRPTSRDLLFELLGESTGDVPPEVLRSPPPHILRAPPPLIPEPRPPVAEPESRPPGGEPGGWPPMAEPEETGAPGAYRLPDSHPSGPRPPDGEPWPPIGDSGSGNGSGPGNGSGLGRGSGHVGGGGGAQPHVANPAYSVLADPSDGGGDPSQGAGSPAEDGNGRGKGWPRAAIAVCVALLVTAAVLLTIIIPSLTSNDTATGTQAAGPSVPPKSEPPNPETSAPETDKAEPPTKPAETHGPRESTASPPVVRPPVTVAIPALTGLSKADATKALKRAGLTLGTVSQVDSPQKIGQVLSSKPASGTSVPRNSTVSLQVSAGLPVPAVTGMQRKPAEAAITAAGLKVGAITRSCSPQPNGQVLSTQPQAGRRVPGSTSIALALARNGTPVPSVVGQARADARAALTAAGFTVRVRDQVVDDESRVGVVLSQSLPPGTCARPAGQIVIAVGLAGQSGPDPHEPTETPTGPVTGD